MLKSHIIISNWLHLRWAYATFVEGPLSHHLAEKSINNSPEHAAQVSISRGIVRSFDSFLILPMTIISLLFYNFLRLRALKDNRAFIDTLNVQDRILKGKFQIKQMLRTCTFITITFHHSCSSHHNSFELNSLTSIAFSL